MRIKGVVSYLNRTLPKLFVNQQEVKLAYFERRLFHKKMAATDVRVRITNPIGSSSEHQPQQTILRDYTVSSQAPPKKFKTRDTSQEDSLPGSETGHMQHTELEHKQHAKLDHLQPVKSVCSQQIEPEYTMNVYDSEVFKDIFTPELITLQEICKRYNMDVRVVGGAPRDILLGITPNDIDLGTTTSPEEMIKIFTEASIRMLEYGPRAISHGTVTVRIDEKVNFEITTTRSDVKTDGRHAAVEFHKDWRKDANRRDFTINAMSIDLDGTLYDYFDGCEDLKKKKILFVGDADARIKEDYLRIMRYFRFCGKIKTLPEDQDLETLETIRQNVEGLQRVAGERIWVELKKVTQGHLADHQMKHIVELGVGENIGLPADCKPADFAEVYTRSAAHYEISESALLSSLLSNKQQVEDLNKRLKVSKVELTTMLCIVEERDGYKRGDLKHYQDYIIDSSDRGACLQRCIQLTAYMADKPVYDALQAWEIPKFPFSAKTFIDGGVPKGRKIARGVEMVKQKWKLSDLTATHEELVEYAHSIIESGDLQ